MTRNERHLRRIREMPCICCHTNIGVEACHIRRSDPRVGKRNAMGKKPRGPNGEECWVLPMCRSHHDRQHEIGEFHFWDQWKIDPERASMALWIHSDDHEMCEEIVRQQRAA